MKVHHFSLSRPVGLLAGALLAAANVSAAEADAFPVLDNNYITFSAAGNEMSGSKAAFQARTQNVQSGALGIEELKFGYDLKDGSSMQIDGRALAGPADYLLQLKWAKDEVGSFDMGYKQFRTFYDGAGGFFPVNNAWLPIYRRPLFVDRGKFFVDAAITLPKAPVFTFKYTNETRIGRKDSTIWGDSNLTGIPIWSVSSLNPYSASRKILPAYIDLDERLETWEATMRHTIGNTKLLLSWSATRMRNNDTRSYDRNVGELRLYPFPASTPAWLVPNNGSVNVTRGYHNQNVEDKGQTFGAEIETEINDKVTLFAGLNYHKGEQTIAEARIITGDVATSGGVFTRVGAYTPGGRPPYVFEAASATDLDVFTGNIGVRARPMPDLSMEVALRGERYKDSGSNNKTFTVNLINPTTAAVTQTQVPTTSTLDNNEKPWTPTVDLRYSGIRNLALYGSWEYRTAKQDEKNVYGSLGVNTQANTVSASSTSYASNIKENHTNFTLGANWTPTQMFAFRAEFFSKDHQNRFDGYGPSLGSFYVLDYNIYGVKLTSVVKPLATLSFTTRYVGQRGDAIVNADGTAARTDANDSRRYMISETIDWSPNKSVYVQASGTLTFDTMKTAYEQVSGTAKDVIRNSDNNYWNGVVTVGFVVDKDMDAQLQATYYRADNYEPAPIATLPFGAGARDYTVTAGLKYKISPKAVATARIGYVESKNELTGGNSNFHGPLAYVALTHAF